MKRSAAKVTAVVTSCVVVFLIAGQAGAASEATHPAAHARVAHARAIPRSAEALAPSLVAPSLRDDDSDGLTRNTNECNRGCIDNN